MSLKKLLLQAPREQNSFIGRRICYIIEKSREVTGLGLCVFWFKVLGLRRTGEPTLNLRIFEPEMLHRKHHKAETVFLLCLFFGCGCSGAARKYDS